MTYIKTSKTLNITKYQAKNLNINFELHKVIPKL